ncbi:ricin-type beta-trefoil lectin domain protein [Actinoplanes sp. NEAU-A12]|uniref:Ricin-type beta-trefoil lectin domain protein n=1 Tax=Actinoplanes sandaracinus TaxID=3045177 RepID=A0ABT6WNS0_9ACTN|nr:ricin-type beta-trefoil lectin domain protein [Actinoplanes sandaracinus]MDI6101361.1 ricin-type beta-trefoil lectin domain protein [Actinoplanes sandaracinus]
MNVTFRRLSGDDRGSLPMAILVTTIGLVLSAAMLPLIVRQVTYTRAFQDRSSALNGAQVGLDMVMARVRAAADVNSSSDVAGRLEDMPGCTFSGDAGIDGTGERLLYSVKITYRNQAGEQLACDPLTELPTSATVESVGSSTTETRTVTATYRFTTTNNNIPGGAIWVSSPTDRPLCLDAMVRPPAPGAAVLMQRCSGSSTQQFAYTEKLYLKLINSETAANKEGMCLFSEVPHAANKAVVFQACPSTEKPTGVYQWSLDGSSRFHSTSATQAIENLCVNVKTPNTVGSGVILATCTANNSTNIFRSDPKIGAGMAGDATNQLVNFAQFSRCLDVTNQNTASTYMIAWFCKQSPNSIVDWNQIWEHPVPDKAKKEISKKGPIVVTKDGIKYCLKSPMSAAGDAYVTVEKCVTNYATLYASATDKSAFGWTVFHDTGSYASSYRIHDNSAKGGLCLQPTDLTAAVKDTHSDGTSKVKVGVCSASELQKWNAPPNLSVPTPITDVTEK